MLMAITTEQHKQNSTQSAISVSMQLNHCNYCTTAENKIDHQPVLFSSAADSHTLSNITKTAEQLKMADPHIVFSQ